MPADPGIGQKRTPIMAFRIMAFGIMAFRMTGGMAFGMAGGMTTFGGASCRMTTFRMMVGGIIYRIAIDGMADRIKPTGYIADAQIDPVFSSLDQKMKRRIRAAVAAHITDDFIDHKPDAGRIRHRYMGFADKDGKAPPQPRHIGDGRGQSPMPSRDRAPTSGKFGWGNSGSGKSRSGKSGHHAVSPPCHRAIVRPHRGNSGSGKVGVGKIGASDGASRDRAPSLGFLKIHIPLDTTIMNVHVALTDVLGTGLDSRLNNQG